MDFSDRRSNLIEEGLDLSIRITRRLGSNDVAAVSAAAALTVLASPDYLSRHGEPQHPQADPSRCLGYTSGGSAQIWQFTVDGELTTIPVRSRLHANNGEVLTGGSAGAGNHAAAGFRRR